MKAVFERRRSTPLLSRHLAMLLSSNSLAPEEGSSLPNVGDACLANSVRSNGFIGYNDLWGLPVRPHTQLVHQRGPVA